MQNLPSAEVYEKEFAYMPWGVLMKNVQEYVCESTPIGAEVLDLLCGPGYLLGKLQSTRKDLKLTGVDLEKEFIQYAQTVYQGIDFFVADAASWASSKLFDVILCTGGLHHLEYDRQEPFVKKLTTLLTDTGYAIVADPYIDPYHDEMSRKIAGAKLGYEYLCATMRNGAGEDVIKASVGILLNDVLLVEYKTSIQRMKPIFEKYFSQVELRKTWPEIPFEYGDYYFILRK